MLEYVNSLNETNYFNELASSSWWKDILSLSKTCIKILGRKENKNFFIHLYLEILLARPLIKLEDTQNVC